MQLWAVLGSRGCREKKIPTANKYAIFGGFFQLLWKIFWNLYVLGLKTNNYCRKKNNQILKTMDKGLTVPRWVLQFDRKYPKCPQTFRPSLSAQAQKLRIFKKKSSLQVSVVREKSEKNDGTIGTYPVQYVLS